VSARPFLEPGDAPRRLAPAESDWPEDLDALQSERCEGLWLLGDVSRLRVRPRVAIVGTRRATPYGLRVTRELSSAFVRAGACVVSGLAAGIDSAAHRAALDAGGTTIGVLGTGMNHVFPRGNHDLQRAVATRGVLMSELEHDEHGWKSTFLVRNRIIAALSTLTIVVEAPIRSGALNTAEHALKLGRNVAAVPGPIDQPQSEGANTLIRDGAGIIASLEDALALAGLTPPPRTPKVDPKGNEGRVWAALADGGLTIDALCARSGLPAAECLAAITTLELAGSLECLLTGEVRRR
jgi:DNA processing protein